MRVRSRLMIGVAAAALFAFLPSRPARAQSAPPIVKASLLLATDAVHPGAAARAAALAQITPGFHVNAHHPTLDYLIPTVLKLDGGKAFSVEEVSYPRAILRKFVFADKGLSVYEGEIVIRATLKVASGTAPGVYALRGSLKYQACNDRACLPPATAPLSARVRVVAANVQLHRINSAVFGKVPSN